MSQSSVSQRSVSQSTVVVGGGLAGVTAALALADAGCSVTLVESRARLGGLASSFRRGQLWVDTGQHVFLRCCTEYRALLERLGASQDVSVQPALDVPVRAVDAGEPRSSGLRRGALPAPLHLAGALLGYRLLSLRERARAVGAARALREVDPQDPATDTRRFGDWLSEHHQSPRAVAALWDLFGTAALNLQAAEASLAAAAFVFQQALLSEATAGDIGWSRVPLHHIHDRRARGALHDAGASVVTGSRVRDLRPAPGGRWTVQLPQGSLTADTVVLAVPPVVAERLLPPGSAGAPGWSSRLGSSPIVNVHVRFDRQVLDGPFLACVGTPVQWIFDRTTASGWAGPGQYVAVTISAADDWIHRPTQEVLARVLPELAAVLPPARQAVVEDAFVTREPQATFRAAPGSARLRPPAGAVLPGLALAGAWTATGWPATMEGAVRSGRAAAEALLADTAGDAVRRAAHAEPIGAVS